MGHYRGVKVGLGQTGGVGVENTLGCLSSSSNESDLGQLSSCLLPSSTMTGYYIAHVVGWADVEKAWANEYRVTEKRR